MEFELLESLWCLRSIVAIAADLYLQGNLQVGGATPLGGFFNILAGNAIFFRKLYKLVILIYFQAKTKGFLYSKAKGKQWEEK